MCIRDSFCVVIRWRIIRTSTQQKYKSYNLELIETNDVRCPDPGKAKEMAELIWKIKGEGDTIGGVVSCVIKGCPIGLGQPLSLIHIFSGTEKCVPRQSA